jgi:serine/threonine protein phosphatase 1
MSSMLRPFESDFTAYEDDAMTITNNNLTGLTIVTRYSRNDQGRDFVIGDLHGCRPLLERLLDHVNFDPVSDRVFSTGDLVDRGPDVAGCLALLKEDWFHSVMGNHEWMLIRYLEARQRGSQSEESLDALDHLLINGGQWVLFYEDDTGNNLSDWLPLLKRLPMISSVGISKQSDRFHVTHGDLMLENHDILTDDQIDQIEEPPAPTINQDIFDDWDEQEVMTRAIWSRRLFHSPGHYESTIMLRQLSLVYAGHTPTLKPKLCASHLFIDGGSFLAYRNADSQNQNGLYMIEHRQKCFFNNGEHIIESPVTNGLSDYIEYFSRGDHDAETT